MKKKNFYTYFQFNKKLNKNNLLKKKYFICNNNLILLNYIINLIIKKKYKYNHKISITINLNFNFNDIIYIIKNNNIYYDKYILIINIDNKNIFNKNIYKLIYLLEKLIINKNIIIIFKILIKKKFLLNDKINKLLKNYLLVIDDDNKKNIVFYIKNNINILKLNYLDKKKIFNLLIEHSNNLLLLNQLFKFLLLLNLKKLKINYLIKYLFNYTIYQLINEILNFNFYKCLKIINILKNINVTPTKIIIYLNNFLIKIIHLKFKYYLNNNEYFYFNKNYINYIFYITEYKIITFISLLNKLQLLILKSNINLFWLNLKELIFFITKKNVLNIKSNKII